VFCVPQAGQAVGQCAQALAGGQIKLDDKALAGKIIKFADSDLMASFENFWLNACCPNSSALFWITSCHSCCCSFVLRLLPNLQLSTL
jgi:hypothetical protein